MAPLEGPDGVGVWGLVGRVSGTGCTLASAHARLPLGTVGGPLPEARVWRSGFLVSLTVPARCPGLQLAGCGRAVCTPRRRPAVGLWCVRLRAAIAGDRLSTRAHAASVRDPGLLPSRTHSQSEAALGPGRSCWPLVGGRGAWLPSPLCVPALTAWPAAAVGTWGLQCLVHPLWLVPALTVRTAEKRDLL